MLYITRRLNLLLNLQKNIKIIEKKTNFIKKTVIREEKKDIVFYSSQY